MKRYCIFFILLFPVTTILHGQAIDMKEDSLLIVNTCSDTLYDNGGPDLPYAPYSNDTAFIYPGTPDKFVRLDFTQLDMEACCDYLRIFNGPGTDNEFTFFNQYNYPAYIYSTDTSGALTLIFRSDGSIEYDGFEIIISCLDSIPGDDLEVKSLVPYDTYYIAGEKLYGNFNVYNNGINQLDTITSGLYVSTDSLLDEDDTLIYVWNNRTFQPFATVSLYIDSKIPGNITEPDTFYLIAKTDLNDELPEDDENNNISIYQIFVDDAEIDVFLDDIEISSNFLINDPMYEWEFDVHNRGNIASPESKYGFFISTDSIFDEGDSLIGSNTLESLLNGRTRQYTYAPYVPGALNLVPGIYYLFIVLDYQNIISETNETNNIFKTQVVVGSSKDYITFSNLQAQSDKIAKGNGLSLDMEVTNELNNSDEYLPFQFYLSADTILNTAQDSAIGKPWFPLRASFSGRTSRFNKKLEFDSTILSNYEPGDYYLFVLMSDDIRNIDPEYNLKYIEIELDTAYRDLSVESTYYLRYNNGYKQINIESEVRNHGSATIESGTYLNYYLSEDTIPDMVDGLLSLNNIYKMEAGGYAKIRYDRNIIDSIFDDMYLITMADGFHVLNEPDEDNNIHYFRIDIPAGSEDNLDLVLYDVDLPDSIYLNHEYTFNCEYKNTYIADIRNNISVFISEDSILDPSDFQHLFLDEEFVAMKGKMSLDITIPKFHDIDTGDAYIIVRLDSKNHIDECDEDNNYFVKKVKIMPTLIDLGLISVDIPGVIMVNGSEFEGSITLEVIGNTSSYGNNVSLYLSGDCVLSQTDQLLFSNDINSHFLSGSGQDNLIFNAQLPDTLSGNKYFLLFTLNNNDGYIDMDDDNNSSFIPIYIQNFMYDIVIDTLYKASSTIFASTITNNSPYIVSYLKTSYYLSEDTILNTESDYAVGSDIIPSLGINQSVYRRYYYSSIPCDVPDGNYYLFIQAEVDSNKAGNAENHIKFIDYGLFDRRETDIVIDEISNLEDGPYHPGQGIGFSASLIDLEDYLNFTKSTLYYYLSLDTQLDESDILTGKKSIYNVNAYVYNVIYGIYLPSDMNTGDYYILIKVDAEDHVCETNENNNIGYKLITIGNQDTDITLTNPISIADQMNAGDDLNFPFSLSNTGTHLSNPFYHRIYLSKDKTYDFDEDINLQEYYYNWGIRGGRSINFNFNGKIPELIKNGRYYLVLDIDFRNDINETNENNNTYFYPITIYNEIFDIENDLNISTLSTETTSAEIGLDISINYFIQNSGTNFTHTTTIKPSVFFYFSNDSLNDSADHLLYTEDIRLYQGTDTESGQFSFNDQDTLEIGKYFIIAMIDPQNKYVETNEDNNHMITPLIIEEHNGQDPIPHIKIDAPVVRVYPNPVENILHVESQFKIQSYKIVDANGKVVMAQKAHTLTKDIYINHLSNGIYMAIFYMESGIGFAKFQVIK